VSLNTQQVPAEADDWNLAPANQLAQSRTRCWCTVRLQRGHDCGVLVQVLLAVRLVPAAALHGLVPGTSPSIPASTGPSRPATRAGIASPRCGPHQQAHHCWRSQQRAVTWTRDMRHDGHGTGVPGGGTGYGQACMTGEHGIVCPRDAGRGLDRGGSGGRDRVTG